MPVAPTVGDAQSSEDAYIVLGLSPDASLDDVKRAGRDLMKLFHPDKGHGDTGKFIRVHEAVLSLTSQTPLADEYAGRQIIVAPRGSGDLTLSSTYDDINSEIQSLRNQKPG